MVRRSLGLVPLLALACTPSADVGTAEPQPEPETAPVDTRPRFVDIYTTDDHGCALERTGLIWCWGESPASRLELREPVEVWAEAHELPTLGPATAIAGYGYTTCALLEDGQVSCWRASDHQDSRYGPELVPGVTDAVDLELDSEKVCVRTETNQVWCSTIEGLEREHVASGVVDFAVNDRRRCGLDDEGQLWCWDRFANSISSSEAELGLELTRGPQGEVLMAVLPGAVEVEVGDTTGDVVVRLDDGRVRIEPQIGPEDVPVSLDEYLSFPGLDGAADLAYGEGHGCIATSEGQVRCYDGNGFAQLGTGDSRYRAEAVTVPGLRDIDRVAASRQMSCAMRSGVGDQEPGLWCWGTRWQTKAEFARLTTHELDFRARSIAVGSIQACATNEAGENLCWGVRRVNQMEIDAQGLFAAATPRPLPLELGPISLVGGVCYLDVAGELRCGHMHHPSAPDQLQSTITDSFEPFLETSGVTGYAYAGIPCTIEKGALVCERPRGRDRAATPKLAKITAIAGVRQGYLCAVHGNKAEVSCFHPEVIPGPEIEDDDDDTKPELPPLDPLDPSELIAIPDLEGVRALIDVKSGGCLASVDGDGVTTTFCLHENNGVHELVGARVWDTLPPADDIVTFDNRLCVLGRDRQVACAAPRDEQAEVLPFADVIEISAYGAYMCLIQEGGTLTCMGHNFAGEVGTPTKSILAQPTQIAFVPAE